jgi:glucose-6-phosphate 1-epimerase
MITNAVDALQDRFGIPGALEIQEGPVGMIRVLARTAAAETQLYLHGAQVTHFQPQGHRPVLFTSTYSPFAPGQANRGGVPIIFPWFGPRAGDPSAPNHGFARLLDWRLESAARIEPDDVTLTLTLESSPKTLEAWPTAFHLRCRITVGQALRLALEVTNTSGLPLVFEEAFHTYLAVGDVESITITGLEDTTYIDKTDAMKRKRQGREPLRITAETDRVFLHTRSTCVVDDPRGRQRITLEKSGSDSSVVWNPWADKARAIKDMGPEEWRSMVCVESGNVADNAVRLGAGERHEMRVTIRANSLAADV